MATTFEVNGHRASVWCRVMLHIQQDGIWTICNGSPEYNLVTELWWNYLVFKIFSVFSKYRQTDWPPTFEVNGHGLLCDVVVMTHIFKQDGIWTVTRDSQIQIWLHSVDKHHFFRFLVNFRAKLKRHHGPDFWNEWSWGFCVMSLWCHTYK